MWRSGRYLGTPLLAKPSVHPELHEPSMAVCMGLPVCRCPHLLAPKLIQKALMRSTARHSEAPARTPKRLARLHPEQTCDRPGHRARVHGWPRLGRDPVTALDPGSNARRLGPRRGGPEYLESVTV